MDDPPGTRRVRTIAGDVAPVQLGSTDYHEHAFHDSPLLPGETLDDPDLSGAEFATLGGVFSSVVDATPLMVGRRSADLPHVAAVSGLQVVATTGRHRDAHYSRVPWVLDLDEDALASLMLRELTVGLARDDRDYRTESEPGVVQGVRAGLCKVGLDYWRITPAERTTMAAIARVHMLTGAPVMVHTERCTAAHEALDLFEAEGVPPSSVALAHADRTPDPGLHASLAERGAYLGYDGVARLREHPESVLLDLTAAMLERGHGDRIMLGADMARRSSLASYGGIPGLAYLTGWYVGRLRDRIGATALTVLLHNPAQWLTWRGVAGQEE